MGSLGPCRPQVNPRRGDGRAIHLRSLPKRDAITYQVHTAVFEGPLDLLLHLITSRELDVAELSLTDLVAEYLEYLDAMAELDLEVASEFLLIAATLIQLKARRLLPAATDPDLDEELALGEARDKLLTRLLACLTFRDVAAVFAHRMQAEERHVARRAGLDKDIVPRRPPAPLPVTAAELAMTAAGVIGRQELEPEVDHLDLELPSIADAMADLRTRMSRHAVASFDELVAHCSQRVEVTAYFAAILELARWGVVGLEQAEPFGPITVTRSADLAAVSP